MDAVPLGATPGLLHRVEYHPPATTTCRMTAPLNNSPEPTRPILNLEGESLGLTIADYDATRPASALRDVHTLCHAPFVVMDLGPQGQVTTCNHFHRFIGNLNTSSWLDIFRSEDWNRLRQNMLDYRISEMDCRHCARQIRSGNPHNAFAQEHFDPFPATTADPRYPTVIIFRLSNVCNLMCVMCNGTLSHRIRNEREKLPPLPPPPYGEQFFKEMEETLPHVRYVEFYGGEPFLVKEHLRILDILEKTGAKTQIYVNTNGTAITPKIKGYIERLNFIKIAVSVDAIYEEIHARQRIGIKHDVCMQNLQWLLDLRNRKKLWVGLNTTETRFNWYHLPVMYQWAARKFVYIHINTCLHPSDTTLYDLPTEELSYIDDYFARWRERLANELPVAGNEQSYSHLQAMVRDELSARREGKKRPNPYPTDRDPIHGGLMSVPELRRLPIDTPATARAELHHAETHGAWDLVMRMAQTWRDDILAQPATDEWTRLLPQIEDLITRAQPLAAKFTAARRAQNDQRTIREAWKLEHQGRFADALETLSDVDEESLHRGHAGVLRSRLLRRMGQLTRAREAIEGAFASLPTDPSTFVELAWLSFDEGDAEAGLGFARRARSLTEPEDLAGTAAWAHALGSLAILRGDASDATDALTALEQAQPEGPIVSELRSALQDMDKAREEIAINRAWRLERSGDFDAALATLDAIGPLPKDPYSAAIPRARALRRAGRLPQAQEVLDRALEQAAGRSEGHVEYAWLCHDANRHEEGLLHARLAMAKSSDLIPAAHALACLAILTHGAEEATRALSTIHERLGLVSFANEATSDDREIVAEAWRLDAAGEHTRIPSVVEAIAISSPLHLEALTLRARAYRRMGDLDASLRTLAYSVAVQPVQLDALIELAWHYYEQKEFAIGLPYALRARALSMRHENPFGVVGWAHPLGLLAAGVTDGTSAKLALDALQQVANIETRARSITAEIEQSLLPDS